MRPQASTSDPPEGRFEIKAIASCDELCHIRVALKQHRQCFSPSYSQRTIYNIYFDTPGYELLGANLDGAMERCKVRLRWYRSNHGQLKEKINDCCLEIKIKRSDLGWKRQYPLNLPHSLAQMSWLELKSEIAKRLPLEARGLFESCHQAVLVNQYDREYFENASGLVRVTIDSNLKYFDQSTRVRPNIFFPELKESIAVVEMKAPHQHSEALSNLIESLPVAVQKHSKYARWVECSPLFGY